VLRPGPRIVWHLVHSGFVITHGHVGSPLMLSFLLRYLDRVLFRRENGVEP